MEKTELAIKVDSFRKIPSPYKAGQNSSSHMYTAICDVTELPEELLNWMETNPRKQNIRSGVAKKIKASLLEGKDFHLLNRGILFSAQSVTFNNYDNTMDMIFTDPEVHGNVDGGHTLRVILENRNSLTHGQQYVKLEILTGVEGIFEDLAAARNTSTQVQDKSIANLRDYFDLIKHVISAEPFRDRVYFMENDDGDIDVGDILAILNLFNIDAYHELDSFPIISFSSRKRCIMFHEFDAIIEEMRLVYKHDQRPWMLGYSGGKDSTLLCQLVFEMLLTLAPEERTKKVYVVTSDTMVENPIVKEYMYRMNHAINKASQAMGLNVEAHMLHPEIRQTFWSLVIGLGYPTPEAPGFRWCTERLKISPSNKFTYDTIKKDGEIVILLGVRKAESAARSRSISSREIEGKLLSPHVSIPKAYVYNPLTEIENSVVWKYLLKDHAQSAWGTDNRYLFKNS